MKSLIQTLELSAIDLLDAGQLRSLFVFHVADHACMIIQHIHGYAQHDKINLQEMHLCINMFIIQGR